MNPVIYFSCLILTLIWTISHSQSVESINIGQGKLQAVHVLNPAISSFSSYSRWNSDEWINWLRKRFAEAESRNRAEEDAEAESNGNDKFSLGKWVNIILISNEDDINSAFDETSTKAYPGDEIRTEYLWSNIAFPVYVVIRKPTPPTATTTTTTDNNADDDMVETTQSAPEEPHYTVYNCEDKPMFINAKIDPATHKPIFIQTIFPKRVKNPKASLRIPLTTCKKLEYRGPCMILTFQNGNGIDAGKKNHESSLIGEAKEWSVTESTFGRAKPGALIFREEFNALNLDVWSHEITMGGGGNGEFQIYQNNRSNSYVKYGKLYLKPTLTADKFGEDFLYEANLHLGGGSPADQCTNPLWEGCERQGTKKKIINPIMSARIRTVDSFSFKYGRVEVRAKVPNGDWLWPAIWLLPQNNQYGSWPASGEIDLLESRGNAELYDKEKVHIGVEQVTQTLHFGPYYPLNGWEKTSFPSNTDKGKGYDKDFHLYQLEWTPEFIKFSIDNDLTAEVHPAEGGFWDIGKFPEDIDNPWKYAENPKMAPFDQKFYFVLNLAVGGTNSYFPDSAKGPYAKPWKNSSPNAMLDFWKGKKDWYSTWKGEDSALVVDYIRVYAI